MNKTPSILCFGELLIDMISETTGNIESADGFLKKFGGAPANTAAGLAKLRIPVYFMGKVGNDAFGHFLKNTLNTCGVLTDTLIESPKDHTTLAFVSLTKTGQRDFTFYEGAHSAITKAEVKLPDNAKIVHFGSLTQITPNAKKATAKLLSQAKEKNLILSYDPNIREALWVNLQKARTVILDTIKQVTIVKVNEEEALLLTKKTKIEQAAKMLFANNLDALFITLGKKGCYYKTKKASGYIPVPIKVKVVDTTGAGDAFNAGYLSFLYESKKIFSDMSLAEIESALKRASVIAALTTTKKGAISAFPSKAEIIQKMKIV